MEAQTTPAHGKEGQKDRFQATKRNSHPLIETKYIRLA